MDVSEIDSELLINEENIPGSFEEECAELKPVIKQFVECYAANKDRTVEEWLSSKMHESLPEKTTEEIQLMTEEIVAAIRENEKCKESLEDAVENGRSKESWFASTTLKATSAMSAQEAAEYLSSLDDAIKAANESLHRTITTQAGNISKNPRLDGFIAEQYHAQTFNLNAEATGSQYRAKVLEPTGNGYAKNSVDIVIVDGNGRTVRRYQSKYCKDAKATEKAFEHGDYRGQQKLVPKGQESELSKKATTVIEAPDGTMSNPLTKSRAEQMRDEAQSGNWNELNWNEYAAKDLTIGIGKQATYAALQGAAIGVGVEVAQKLWNGEEIDGEELVETALASGADFGLKVAAAGALKVGVEKEIIPGIPKETPAGIYANIAYVGIEDAKIAGKMATGELSAKEGVEKIEQTTVAAVAGLCMQAVGKDAGEKVIGKIIEKKVIGTIIGPVGTVLGGFIGGTIGYMAGAKVGETIVKGVQKVRSEAVKVVKNVASDVKRVAGTVISGVRSFGRRLAGFLGF